jgi:transmembrane sensor
LRLNCKDLIFKMTKIDIRDIITKYLRQEATAQEISFLSEWVKHESNKELFVKTVQVDFFINHPNYPTDSQMALQQFLKHIKGREQKKESIFFKKKKWLRYAAVFVIMLCATSYFIINRNITAQLLPNPNSITIQLDSGEFISIDQDIDTIIQSRNGVANINFSNGVLHLNNISKQKKITGYNTLKVPNGKIIAVSLEDGSIVKLNSGSELKYPTSFLGKSKREVFLKGEAFFTIAKNTNKPFIVNTKGLFTKVFGTVFNISAYDRDSFTEVVLVEGSVGIGSKNNTNENTLKMIKPAQKLTGFKTESNVFKVEVEDVDIFPYISWTKGMVVFQDEQLSEIINKLERRFNVKVINNNETLGKQRFTGVFNEEGIELILKTIKVHTNFDYIKNGSTITINKE